MRGGSQGWVLRDDDTFLSVHEDTSREASQATTPGDSVSVGACVLQLPTPGLPLHPTSTILPCGAHDCLVKCMVSVVGNQSVDSEPLPAGAHLQLPR